MRVWMMAMAVLMAGCMASSLTVQPTGMGKEVASEGEMFESAATPGPIEVTEVVAARWVVPKEGLINLDHARAKEAKLKPGDEPIHIAFWVLEHPTRGTYLIDSGVARGFRDPRTDLLSPLVASYMKTERIEVLVDTHTWLGTHGPVKGVFLTHAHLDHIMGLPDVPDGVPVYMGPGETVGRNLTNLFVQGTTDGLLGRGRTLRSWKFRETGGVLDIFGDGSAYVLHTPGHTPGSVSFLVRSTQGPELIVGDASHTDWGWRNCVEPGTFNEDGPRSAESLRRLRALLTKVPGLRVRLGHQHHDHAAASLPCPSK